ncbi:hypothetical protein IIA79_07920 [bacterium]|nr:hypothetical protein [bacterium]
MSNSGTVEIIRKVINQAAEKKGWSLAQLTRRVGKGENTLHRWRTGATSSFDMETLVELFKMAGLSMDQEFGISTGKGAEQIGGSGQLSRIHEELQEMKNQLHLLQPVTSLMTALGQAVAGTRSFAPSSDSEVMAQRAQASREVAELRTALSDAVNLGEKLARVEETLAGQPTGQTKKRGA